MARLPPILLNNSHGVLSHGVSTMSAGFVSGGTIDEPTERDDEWHRVQQEIEEERRRKAELGKQDGGKSLFEVLQQNKSRCLRPAVLLPETRRREYNEGCEEIRTENCVFEDARANMTGWRCSE